MATKQQRAWAEGWGWPPAHYARPKLTPQQREAIRQRLTDGESIQALALEYRVSRRTIEFYR